jgi:hypothetical protein
LRRAQAISLVDAAVVLTFGNCTESRQEGEPGEPPVLPPHPNCPVEAVAITLGAVAPTIVHARSAEIYLAGQELNEANIAHTAELAVGAAHPIDDVRSSAKYRSEMVRVCVRRALRSIAKGEEMACFPRNPVLLWGQPKNSDTRPLPRSTHHAAGTPIITRINGVEHVFQTGQNKTLLRLLREEAGLIGTKEGCAEGE